MIFPGSIERQAVLHRVHGSMAGGLDDFCIFPKISLCFLLGFSADFPTDIYIHNNQDYSISHLSLLTNPFSRFLSRHLNRLFYRLECLTRIHRYGYTPNKRLPLLIENRLRPNRIINRAVTGFENEYLRFIVGVFTFVLHRLSAHNGIALFRGKN